MKLRTLLYASLATLLLAGCESQLEIDPISDISNANFWKNQSDVEGYLTGAYCHYRFVWDRTTYGEDRGDGLEPGTLAGRVSRAFTQSLDNENGYDWRVNYTDLHHVNLILKYAPGIPFGSEKDKNRVMAQAYTLRAHNYMMLLQMWGDVPLVLEPTESYNKDNKPSRQPKEDVMRQILSDLDMALELFPEKGIPDKYRISRPSALMLKAEALAWNYTVLGSGDKQNLTDAVAALDEVEKCGVSLMENYSDVFDVKHRLNSEIIFALYVRYGEYDNMYAYQMTESAVQGQIKNAVNKDQIPYTEGNIASPAYAPSKKLRDSFSAADKRRGVCYIDGIDKNGKVLFTCQNKFRGTAYDNDRYFDSDIVVYRLADALLLKAELLCYLDPGKASAAISLINQTRERAGLGKYDGPADVVNVRKEVLDERFRELCLELKRWPDLMRAHAAGTVNIYEEVPNLKGKNTPLYFPISLQMRDYNENLKQTDGYETY